MCKGVTPGHQGRIGFSTSFLLVALVWVYVPAEAQVIGTGTFRDGLPDFTFIDTTLTRNVRLDSVVSLRPQTTSLAEPDTFRVVLSGIDWRYTGTDPAILSAEDVDRIPGPEPSLYLITDGTGRRVYLINAGDQSKAGEFGGPLGSAKFLEKPVDAFPYFDNNRLKMIITDQGRHRVIQVDWLSGAIEWQYGGTQGSGQNQLSSPTDAVSLGNGGEALICDTGNNRVIVIDTTSKTIQWSFGGGSLNMPVDVEVEPATGLFLITDQGNHRAILVQRSSSQIVWQFGQTGQAGSSDSTLNNPTDADVLPNGNVLICDAGNNRLIEVNRQKEIVYRFVHPLSDLRDADRITENVPDRDKTLVVANNRPISQSIQAFRLAYFNETYVSTDHDFGRAVNYDSLRFRARASASTPVRLQLRSANVLADLQTAPWYGPTSTTDFYTATITETNPDTVIITTAINPIHDGDRFYQFRAFLDTNSPRLTPELLGVEVWAHYYPDSTGIITSQVIRDPSNRIIIGWQKLIVNTVLPADPLKRNSVRIEVRVLDESGSNVLQSFSANTTTSANDFDLTQSESLRRRQVLRLQAHLKTNNSSVTPRLNDWGLTWQNTIATASRLRFTDASNQEVSYYRVPAVTDDPSPTVGTVFLTLEDINLLPIENSIRLEIRAQRSGDLQSVLLAVQPSGQYLLRPGYPAVVSNFSVRENGILEVRDRDTLSVRYLDPTDPADSSIARVVMIRSASGSIRVENSQGVPVDTVAAGDLLYVRVIGETDRDFSSAQDSVVATLFNGRPNDLETLMLYEVGDDTTRLFNTGEFRSRVGVPLVTVASIYNDGRLRVIPGDQILAEYVDNTRLQISVLVKFEPGDSTILILAGNKAFDFFVAPNPFNIKQHTRFRLAAVARTGDMTVQKVEIYNLAGERIRSIPGDAIRFQGQTAITRLQPAFSDNWWDFRTDDGALAAPGTYWAKFYVRLNDSTSGRTQDAATLRKFVIIR